jgi:hypothetical protein
MRTNRWTLLASVSFLLGSELALANQLHQFKTVGTLEAAPGNSECFYFTLQGVSAADSAVSSSPFFAVHKNQAGYTQIYALLLAAKVSGALVTVQTTGTQVSATCGTYVGVHDVFMT